MEPLILLLVSFIIAAVTAVLQTIINEVAGTISFDKKDLSAARLLLLQVIRQGMVVEKQVVSDIGLQAKSNIFESS